MCAFLGSLPRKSQLFKTTSALSPPDPEANNPSAPTQFRCPLSSTYFASSPVAPEQKAIDRTGVHLSKESLTLRRERAMNRTRHEKKGPSHSNGGSCPLGKRGCRMLHSNVSTNGFSSTNGFCFIFPHLWSYGLRGSLLVQTQRCGKYSHLEG